MQLGQLGNVQFAQLGQLRQLVAGQRGVHCALLTKFDRAVSGHRTKRFEKRLNWQVRQRQRAQLAETAETEKDAAAGGRDVTQRNQFKLLQA